MGDIPDDWRGEYNGPSPVPPTDWKEYKWFKQKGEQGDTGAPATLVGKSVTYKVGDSGSIIPSGAWGSSVPVVSQGKYLWTKTELRFNSGDPVVFYSVARMGIDGTGSVSSVCGVSPDADGNVALVASDVGAVGKGGTVTLLSSGWSNRIQTVAVEGVTEDVTKSDVIASPEQSGDNLSAYRMFGVRPYAQLDGAVQFICNRVPDVDLTVNLLVRR